MEESAIGSPYVIANGDEDAKESCSSGGSDDEEEEGCLVENKPKKSKRKTRSQEAVTALLSAYDEDCSEQFGQEGVEFRDLSSLNEKDLILFGIKDPEQMREMIENFASLPNQNQHYDGVLKSSEAEEYNEEILAGANAHLQTMKTSLAAANLKLRIDPSTDVVVEDRYYASRFVLDALEELKKMTGELEHRLKMLENTIDRKRGLNSSRRRKLAIFTLSCLTTGISLAFWFWKRR